MRQMFGAMRRGGNERKLQLWFWVPGKNLDKALLTV